MVARALSFFLRMVMTQVVTVTRGEVRQPLYELPLKTLFPQTCLIPAVLIVKLWSFVQATDSLESTGMKARRSGTWHDFSTDLSLAVLFPFLECSLIENTNFGIRRGLHPLRGFLSLGFFPCKTETPVGTEEVLPEWLARGGACRLFL